MKFILQSIYKLSSASKAFTLAELLIALAILGVIATFTIPKVLTVSQNQQLNAIAREDISALSGAYDAYKLQNGAPLSTMTSKDLTPFLNYVSFSTSGVMDTIPGYVSIGCVTTTPCIKMHNGSMIFFRHPSFSGTNSTNAISVYIDPDGQMDNDVNGRAKVVHIYLYYNGRITDIGNTIPGTTDSAGAQSAVPSLVPSWFSWN